MGSPFDEVDGELRLIQYRPHQNCHLVNRFVGGDAIECGGDGGIECREADRGAFTFAVPAGKDDWIDAEAGDWIATRDGKTFEVVDADNLIDFIRGTSRTHLSA